MRITEEQLRISIRRILNEAEGVKVQKPAATQKTPQFVLPPRLTPDEWISFGSQQSVQDAKTFKFESYVQQVVNLFNFAKSNRIDYLAKDYVKRYTALASKLGITPKLKPEVMRDLMIERIKGTQLTYAAYPAVINKSNCSEATYEGQVGYYIYTPTSDKIGTWARMARASFGEYGLNLEAAASPYRNIVGVKPPSLLFNTNMKFIEPRPDRTALDYETLEHEIVHQELYALTQHLGISPDKGEEYFPSSLAKQLLSRSMISEEMLTVPYIKSLMSKNTNFKVCLETQLRLDKAEPEFKDLRLITWLAMFCMGVDPAYDANSVIDNYIETQPDEKTREMLFEAQIIKDEIKARIADLTLPDHIRETLMFLRDSAGLRSPMPGVAESDLSELYFNVSSEESGRAAVVVAVTNQARLQDLTLVAVNEPSKQGAQGTGSALAERWTRLAGI